MIILGCSCSFGFQIGETMIRGIKGSGVKITARSFKFDGDKLKYKLNYQGKGKAPDKRFDKNCEGLCIFIWPSGTIVFYAYKWVEMYNHKKGKLEKNCKYKRMFKFQDIKGYKYRDAKDKLKEALEELNSPVAKDDSELLLKDLSKRFLKEGMQGARLDDPDLMYKAGTKARYTQYIKSFLLLKHENRERIKSLTKTIIYKNKTSNRPIGDYLCSEIKLWHIEVLRKRLEDTPPTAEAVVQMVSIIFKWAISNNILKGENPCKLFAWKTSEPFKAKLLDDDTAKLKKYVAGKAFDYQPHFLSCVGLHLFLGQRSLDIFGLRWEAPLSEEEKIACSGWLLDGWETVDKPKLYLWDMKNRKGAKIHIDQDSLAILKRLKEATLFKIGEQAKKDRKWGTCTKIEELRGKLGGLYIERLQTMNINKELTEDQLNDNLRKSFPTKKDWLEGQLATMEDLYPDDDTTINLVKLIKEINKKIAEEEKKGGK